MTAFSAKNLTRATELVVRGSIADNPWRRMVGLLRHKSLEAGDGLWISPCNSIHSFGMKFNFDAVFIDRNGIVLKACADIPRNKIGPHAWKAHSVIELPSGTIALTSTQTGDQLELKKLNAQ